METSTQTMEIARTILNQIQYADRTALMAWGASSYAAISPSREYQGGIAFKVLGRKHQGWVKVLLRWADDYTVEFINQERQLIKTSIQCYCDMLVPVIDWIEEN